MVTTKTESGWQGTDVFLQFLSIIWSKNHTYLEKINDSDDLRTQLKALSDYYYGLRNLRSVLVYFIESEENSKKRIELLFNRVKEKTGEADITRCTLNWDEIHHIRNTLIEIQDEMFRILGSSRLLVPITRKRIFDDLTEEVNEENV